MKIVTHYDYPPIPDRSMDWSAIDDDTYDGAEDAGPLAHMIGRGPTEEAAIQDLKNLLAEHDMCSECGEPGIYERGTRTVEESGHYINHSEGQTEYWWHGTLTCPACNFAHPWGDSSL
jgi:hypothetical protein